MDQTQLQQKIAEYFAKLPADAQAMFSSMNWMKTLENISTKYNFTAEQVQSIGTETTLLLLGIIHPDEYTNFLQTDLGLPEDIQGQLMSEVNMSILNKWRTTLAQTYNQNADEVAEKEYGGAEKLNSIFANLPKEVQDAIANSNYQKELYMIANEEKLSIEQMGKLESATNKVILGMESPDNYEKTIEAELGLAPDKALELSSKINTRVLMSIRNAMKGQAISKPQSVPVAPVRKEPEVPEPTIPKPPYQEARKPITPLVPRQPSPQSATGEDQILNNSGIEVMAENSFPKNLPTTEEAIKEEEAMLGKDGVSIVEPEIKIPTPTIEPTPTMEQETLAGVENPSKSPTHVISGEIPERKANVVRDKFSQPVMNLQGASDQSNPNPANNLHKDPYREPIE